MERAIGAVIETSHGITGGGIGTIYPEQIAGSNAGCLSGPGSTAINGSHYGVAAVGSISYSNADSDAGATHALQRYSGT
jgi:hypothetical protein